MIHFWFLIWLSIGLSWGEQYYDGTSCTSDVDLPGTRYTCDSSPQSCQTFLVYRANEKFQTIAKISSLFNMTPDELVVKNNDTTSLQILDPGREVLVPITCSCIGKFYVANLSYIFPGSMTLSDIACRVFEGLVKSITLNKENSSVNTTLQVGSILQIPLKCACPVNFSSNFELRYLVTYPIVEKDSPNKVSKKFGIPVGDLWEANHLDPFATVYPYTTVLVPLKSEPSINYDITPSEPPNSPGFVPIESVERSSKNTQLKKVYISVSVVGFVLVLVTLIACGLYLKALKKCKAEKFNSFARRSSMTSFNSTPRSSQLSGPTPAKSSTASCLSPDLLESIKYSLGNYTVEELKKATNDFNEENRIIDDVYKGFIDNAEILIKQTRFEDTRQIIDVHSKINHVNIVKLHGVCYSDNDFSWSYLVFEFPSNGCLRSCLSSSNPSLRWQRRTQIAFDIATGLHYLHYCMVPPYAHMNVNSKTIFLTINWRAKIAVFETMPTIGCSKDHDNITSIGGWGIASEKEDIFAFGVVLLELISAKEDLDGKSLTESIAFLGGEASDQGGCFDHLRNFVDPSLKEDYPLAEALCLAVLAKACIEDDPNHRPSMDDILKVLSRMV